MATPNRGLLTAAVLLSAAALAVAQDSSSKAGVYALEPGTVLVYETSGSLTADMVPGGGQSARFLTRYTVLTKDRQGLTLLAAIDPRSDDSTTGAQSDEDIGGRFTFQLETDGTLGERMAGVTIPPFMGWTPLVDFPPVPEDSQTSLSWPLPAFGVEIPVVAKRTEENGNAVVTLELDPAAGGGSLAGFTGKYVYSPEEKAIVSSQYVLEASSSGPNGQPLSISLSFDSKRASQSKLAASDLEKLRKDVAAGVPVFEKVREAMSQMDQDTTKALEAIEGYLKQFPEGEFARIYSEQKKLIERMTVAAERAAALKEGTKAPDFTAKTLEGETLKLSDLRGRVVLLDFWASWCGPCVNEMPNVKKTYEEFKDKGFTVVGISADHTEKNLRDFLAENKYDWKMIYQPPDEEGTILEQYGIQKFPTTFLLDREGTIRAVDLRGEELHNAVKELVQQKK